MVNHHGQLALPFVAHDLHLMYKYQDHESDVLHHMCVRSFVIVNVTLNYSRHRLVIMCALNYMLTG